MYALLFQLFARKACSSGVVCAAALLIPGTLSAQATADVSQMATGEIEQQAVFLVGSKKYSEATPYLAELVSRLGESTDEQIKAKAEGFRYFLALGYVFSNKWEEAAAAFADFLKNHPKSNRVRKVTELHGDALVQCKRYPEAQEQYKKLLALRLPEAESLPLMEKLASAYMRDRKWAEAVPVLLELAQKSRSEEQREQAVVWLAQSYIESNQGDKVIELLPDMLTKAPNARLNIDFNMTLLNGGDRMRSAAQDVLALLFYKLVLPPAQLLAANQRLEAGLLRRREQVIAGGQFEFVVDINRRIQDLQADREVLKGIPDFSEDLLMRIAQSYFASKRFYEAFWTFWKIYQEHPKGKLAEQSCYGAFALAGQLEQNDKAREAGLKYLGSFPEGEHWEEVSLGLGKIFIRAKDYPTAIKFYTEILKARPNHAFKDEILFMTGFSQFQDGQLAEARKTFQALMQEFPKSEHALAGYYWTGMTYLFEDNYKEALGVFENFLTRTTAGNLYEDASFRIPLCLYALQDYVRAAEKFHAFLKEFPASSLRAEVQTLLGDTYGATGELDKALSHYKEVEGCAVKQSQTDYAALQVGRIYEQTERYKEMEDWFDAYLKKYGLKGDYTQAIYRKGLAQQARGKSQEALDTYLKAMEQFGNDPGAIGIDVIMDAYLQEAQSLTGQPPVETLRAAAQSAMDKKERARFLRLQRAISQADPGAPPPEIGEADLPFASPAVLLWMAKIKEKDDPKLAEASVRALIEKFPVSPSTGEAWLRLGDLAYARKDLKQAGTAYAKVIKLVPSDPISARANMRLGDIARAQKRPDEAIKRYEEVLQVKEWKGEIWPEALYQIGESLRDQGKDRESYAMFQRIFVLYPHYTTWTAKAYLRCAAISEKLGLKTDAIRTLEEMLGNPALRATPEYASAEQKLREIQ